VIIADKRIFFVKWVTPYFPLLILIPFYIAITIPGFPVLSIVRLIILFLLLSWFLTYGPIHGIMKLINPPLVLILFIGYFLLPLISASNSYVPHISKLAVFGEGYLLLPFFYSMGYYFLNSPSNRSKYLKYISYVTIILSILGLIEFFTGFNLVTYLIHKLTYISQDQFDKFQIRYNSNVETSFRLTRARTTFNHGISFGTFVASFSLLFFHDIRTRMLGISNIFNYLGLILLPFVIFASGSRTPILVFILVYLTYFILYTKDRKRIQIMVVILPVLALSMYKLYNIFYFHGLGFSQDSGRLLILSDFLVYLKRLDWVGIGPKMFGAGLGASYGDWIIIDPMAYNLTRIVETGILYIPVFVYITWRILKKYYNNNNSKKLCRNDKEFNTLVLIWFICSIPVSFISISLFNVGHVGTAILWMLIGSVFAMSKN